jgi:hypothetical protein
MMSAQTAVCGATGAVSGLNAVKAFAQSASGLKLKGDGISIPFDAGELDASEVRPLGGPRSRARAWDPAVRVSVCCSQAIGFRPFQRGLNNQILISVAALCITSQWFPIVPVALPQLKLCSFGAMDDPEPSPNDDFYRSGRFMEAQWAAVGNPVQALWVPSGGHGQTCSYRQVLDCLLPTLSRNATASPTTFPTIVTPTTASPISSASSAPSASTPPASTYTIPSSTASCVVGVGIALAAVTTSVWVL